MEVGPDCPANVVDRSAGVDDSGTGVAVIPHGSGSNVATEPGDPTTTAVMRPPRRPVAEGVRACDISTINSETSLTRVLVTAS